MLGLVLALTEELGDTDGELEALVLELGETEPLGLGLGLGLGLVELDGLTDALALTLGLGDTEADGDVRIVYNSNTTPVLPASVPELESHVRLAMLEPSVVSPELTAIEAPDPRLDSVSNLVIQFGLEYTENVSNAVLSKP